jgi:hypothetical protein
MFKFINQKLNRPCEKCKHIINVGEFVFLVNDSLICLKCKVIGNNEINAKEEKKEERRNKRKIKL